MTVRLMESANHWQINFYRSGSLALFAIIVLVIRYRGRVGIVFQLAGWKAALAGAFVGLAMICNIFALTHTTVAGILEYLWRDSPIDGVCKSLADQFLS